MTDTSAAHGDIDLESTTDEQAANDPKTGEQVNWWMELRGLFFLLLAVLFFHSLFAKPFYIPSMSMMPNLQVGDRLIVSKYPYGYSWASASFHILPPFSARLFGRTPEYGDIVIVTPKDTGTDYIKRVVALPGDTAGASSSLGTCKTAQNIAIMCQLASRGTSIASLSATSKALGSSKHSENFPFDRRGAFAEGSPVTGNAAL